MKNMQLTDFIKKKSVMSDLRRFPRAHIATIGTLGVALSALLLLFPAEPAEQFEPEASRTLSGAIVPATEARPTNAVAITTAPETTANPTTTQPDLTPESPTPADAWHTETVRSGDNLSLIFQRAGLTDKDMYAFISSTPATKQLQRLHPGHTFAFKLTPEGELEELRFQLDALESTLFTRTDDGFKATSEIKKPDIEVAYREATINNSLFVDGQRVHLDTGLIMELANIFGWDIDFALDIHRGDSFKVVYEEKFLDGKKIGTGQILSAQFTNQGKTFKTVRYTDTDGDTHYYTPEGNTMRKAFLRTPIDFARISSHFNLNRKHPILNTIRAHKGTDYAAATGTPIKSTGDGKVIHASSKGAYGNAVIIQHGQGYKTLYAHMSKFGKYRVGSRVRQGDVIGYVGSTGLATGPHLHYEFYVNGTVRNPVTVELPKSPAIAQNEKQRFRQMTAPLLAQLDGLGRTPQLAQLDSDSTAAQTP